MLQPDMELRLYAFSGRQHDRLCGFQRRVRYDYARSALHQHFVYNVLSAASTPTFSPAAGDYGSTQSVTISASTGPTICYNFTGAPATNGTTGCANGTLYSRRDIGPFGTDHLRSGWWNRLWRQPGGVIGIPDSLDRF